MVANGRNALPRTARPTLLARAGRQLLNPLSLILLVAGVLTVTVLARVAEGLWILAIVVLNTAIGVRQEREADDALAALEELTAPSCKVWRDGQLVERPAEELVQGDVVELAAGDRIPADVRLSGATSMAVDEAILTGESLPVDKVDDDEAWAGTLVVRGSASASVVATGASTKLGRIATALDRPTDPPLVAELARIATRVSLLAVALGAVLGVTTYVRGAGQPKRFAEALLTAVAMAIAAVPEGLATMVLSALALGTRRLARRGVIVRQLTAIEALGSTTVLCADKTGTITSGVLAVAEVFVVPGREARFWLAAERANDAVDGVGDPLDVALMAAVMDAAMDSARDAAADRPDQTRSPRVVGTRLATAPFDTSTRSMTTVHRHASGAVISVKGAPETVLARCRPGPDTDAVRAEVSRFAARGLRVLALAEHQLDDQHTDDQHTDDQHTDDQHTDDQHTDDQLAGHLTRDGLTPLGLVALGDPLRASAASAIADCRRAGIRVVMVTGDHATTARAVADAAGIAGSTALDGSTIAGLDPQARVDALRSADVVARVEPSVKTALIDAHRSAGAVVAMTGDGVNDAPALRRADVGVAIAGAGGTDVAREAASVIVTDGDLGTIVAGVEEGRRIYRNLANVVRYLLTGNLTEVLVVLGALVAVPELRTPLLPVQLLWINLITDGLPGLALGTDAPVGDPLAEAPRSPGDDLLSPRRLLTMVVDALVIAALVLGSARIALSRFGWEAEVVRSTMLLSLLACHLLLAYVVRARMYTFERGWAAGRVLLAAIAGSLALQGVAFTVPLGRRLLGLRALPPSAWGMALGAGVMMVVLLDLGAAVRRRLRRRP